MRLDASPHAVLHIGHERVSESSAGTYHHLHPVTQKPQATIPLAGKAEMDRAIEKAQAAFPAWRTVTPEQRRDMLMKLAGLIHENAEEFARLAALDGGTALMMGVPMAHTAAEFHAYYAGWADKIDGKFLAMALFP